MKAKLIALLIAISLTLGASPREWAFSTAWNNTSDEERYYMDAEYKAIACGLTLEEFNFFARVVEAESNRGDELEPRVYIALVILNRVNCSNFPNTVSEVLRQAGQFEVVVNGECSTSSTLLSEWAIVEAYRLQARATELNDLVYFNCIGFSSWAIDYDEIGGNYFSRSGCSCEHCGKAGELWQE